MNVKTHCTPLNAPGFDPLAIVWHRRNGQPRVLRLKWSRPSSIGTLPVAACVEAPPAPIAALAAQLRSMLGGKAAHPSLDLVDFADASPFARAVWSGAHDLPWGQVVSYGQLAAAIGHPRAARAVGQALAANPLPLIVPCHRIIKADGSLGGFNGPKDMKARLLRLEGISIRRNRKIRASRESGTTRGSVPSQRGSAPNTRRGGSRHRGPETRVRNRTECGLRW